MQSTTCYAKRSNHMKTYAIYEAIFSGSADYMSHCKISVAAVSITQAIRKFREWDECAVGGSMMSHAGLLIYRDAEHGWVRPSEITKYHITKNTQIRAISPRWSDFSRA